MPTIPYTFRDGAECTCGECHTQRTADPPAPPSAFTCDCTECRTARISDPSFSGCLRADCALCDQAMEVEHGARIGRMPRPRNARCAICGERETACVCHTCDSCGERRSMGRFCPHCNDCRDGCCECRICQYCSNHIAEDEEQCATCQRCPECCGCRPNSEKFWGEPSARYPSFLGVEIECGIDSYPTKLTRACKQWGAVLKDDGSIEGTSTKKTLELATCPARGDKFVEQITTLCDGLQKGGARVNRSCGLHVHVDVRDFTDPQILGAARLYCRIEPALYSIVARSRRTNHYSKSFAEAWGSKKIRSIFSRKDWTGRQAGLDILLYGNLENAAHVKTRRQKTDARYHGLNLNAVPLHGTLEFRLHQGTINVTKILMWSAICTAVVRYAEAHSEESIGAMVGSPIAILEAVLADSDPDNAQEIIAWTRVRRRHFLDLERKQRGMPPVRRPQHALKDLEAFASIPDEDGENEPAERRRSAEY